MSDTDALIAFLRARLTDDETIARRVSHEDYWFDVDGWSELATEVGDHAHHHGPARVRAEAAATRQLIERYEHAAATPTTTTATTAGPFTHGHNDGYRQACLDAIRDAAHIHADHPDYRPEWAPTLLSIRHTEPRG